MTTKRIGYTAPYTSETFNLKDSSLFGEDCVITGMSVTDNGDGTATVDVGTFIYNGILVEIDSAQTISITDVDDEGYIIATTPDSQGETFTISAVAAYTDGAILATYNGTEWVDAPRKLELKRIAKDENSNKNPEAGFLSCRWTTAVKDVTLNEPEAIFDDGTTFIAGLDYTKTLETSVYHWLQHAVCALRRDNILTIEAQPLGTLFAGTVSNKTEVNSNVATKVRVCALDGEHFAVAALVGGVVTCYFYAPSSTSGTCALAWSVSTTANDVTDFDCCAYGDSLYLVYVNTADPTRLKICEFTYAGGSLHDNYLTVVESTNITNPKIRISGTQLYAAWKENTGNYLYMARTDVSAFPLTGVPSKLTIYNDDVTMDPDFDLLPLKEKIYWLCLFSGPILREFETNLSGGERTTIADVDADNDCTMPRIIRNGWGNVCRSWIADDGVSCNGYLQITKPAVPTDKVVTYTQLFTGANLAEAKLYVNPMANADFLVLHVNQHDGSHGYNRVNVKGESVYTHTVMPGVSPSQVGDVAVLESGAAAISVATSSKVYAEYVPTAGPQTKFNFPINGIELVRATTEANGNIDMSWTPRAQRTAEGIVEANSSVEANRIKVSIPSKGITREIVNPYGGIHDALDLINDNTPSANDKAYMDIGPGKYPILEAISIEDDNIEIRGNNSTIETHTIFLSDTYNYFVKIDNQDNITIKDLNIVPDDVNSITGIELTGGSTNIVILNNMVYGTPAIYIHSSISDFIIENNDCVSYSGDAIVVET